MMTATTKSSNGIFYVLLIFLSFMVHGSGSWSVVEKIGRKSQRCNNDAAPSACACQDDSQQLLRVVNSERRRLMIWNPSMLASTGLLMVAPSPSAAVPRAVGGAEQACIEAGDCLQRLELDGAIGWTWGGKDRCDASDPRCGPEGKLRDSPIAAAAVPSVLNAEITHLVDVSLVVGRNETGLLRMGLFGKECPQSVQQLVDFLSSTGLTTTSDAVIRNSIGASTLPVSMRRGGIVTSIVPFQRIEFGVPSQAAAYAKSVGRFRAGETFVPQSRPTERLSMIEPYPQKHNVAGLISIPGDGIGFASGVGTPDDEIFANAFQITAAPVPRMDQERRRVIGQVLDDESMAFLARLASLPTRKGLKGVIPGQNAGPPLLRVVVSNIKVEESRTQNQ